MDNESRMTTHRSQPVIGILGGIGAGKSTVAAEFAALGCARLDADAIGHELLAEPDVQAEIRRRWGDGVFGADGRIARRALGRAVFAQPQELAELNKIMHPRIRRRLEQRLAELRQDASVPAVVLDAAIMLEAGWDDLCTDLVFVEAPPQARQERVVSSRGWAPTDWQGREKSQISLDKKRQKCKYSLDNSSNVSCLRERIRELFRQIIHPADRSQ